jgi:probable HAF family extracellular repeat protein
LQQPLATDETDTIFDPPQSGAHSSLAEAINDSGTVVGTYRDANLVRHGYLRQPDGTFVSFDDPNAAQLPLSITDLGTNPRGINANGTVVGFYADANGVRHGFIWQ